MMTNQDNISTNTHAQSSNKTADEDVEFALAAFDGAAEDLDTALQRLQDDTHNSDVELACSDMIAEIDAAIHSIERAFRQLRQAINNSDHDDEQ
jgi:ribosome-associated translation inhibitor RaiA